MNVYRAQAGESADKHFAQVVDSCWEDLPQRLRHAIRLLASKNIPVDWNLLFTHLIGWSNDSRWVQWCWSRDYWTSRDRSHASERVVATSLTVNSPESEGA
jgi:CRISPR type I-E-associated protein CasB/Cse2